MSRAVGAKIKTPEHLVVASPRFKPIGFEKCIEHFFRHPRFQTPPRSIHDWMCSCSFHDYQSPFFFLPSTPVSEKRGLAGLLTGHF